MAEPGPRSSLHRAFCKSVVAGLKALPPTTQAWIHGMYQPIGRLDYPRADIKMLAGNKWQRMRLKSCEKEPETVAWLESQLRPDDVLYDIGANVGAYSLIAAAVQPKARVVAFEPSATTYGSLVENIALNNMGDRVQAFCLALAAESKIETFTHSSLAPGAAWHNLGPGHKGQPQATICMPLDDFVHAFQPPGPTLVKIDIDGEELALLKGARQTLANPSVRSVLLEILLEGETEEAKILETVHQLGFQVASRTARGNDRTFNLLFERTTAAVMG